MFRQGSYYLAQAKPVLLSVLYGNAFLSCPIEGPGVGLVVKGMWGDKCQVFDSPQASNPGGRVPAEPEHRSHFSCDRLFDLCVFTEHWARNGTEEEMWSR